MLWKMWNMYTLHMKKSLTTVRDFSFLKKFHNLLILWILQIWKNFPLLKSNNSSLSNLRKGVACTKHTRVKILSCWVITAICCHSKYFIMTSMPGATWTKVGRVRNILLNLSRSLSSCVAASNITYKNKKRADWWLWWTTHVPQHKDNA